MNKPPQKTLCPHCGSDQVSPVRKSYDPGLGCLGYILFGWLGCLVGLLDSNDIEMYCTNCGHRWQPGKSQILSCFTCLIVIIVILTIIVLIS